MEPILGLFQTMKSSIKILRNGTEVSQKKISLGSSWNHCTFTQLCILLGTAHSGILRRVKWWLVTDVSGQPIVFHCKFRTVKKESVLLGLLILLDITQRRFQLFTDVSGQAIGSHYKFEQSNKNAFCLDCSLFQDIKQRRFQLPTFRDNLSLHSTRAEQ